MLAWQHQQEACRLFDLSLAETEEIILESGLLPARYQRNRDAIPAQGQLILFGSQVAVIGCGGLGGYVIEQLARLGVGRIVAVDPDYFEEHNLNRQLLSSVANLGSPKAAAAAQRVSEINPAVTLEPLQTAFSRDNGSQILAGSMVAVDALDNVGSRLELAATCDELKIPLVHGAIAGWYGQVATQFPSDGTLQDIYRSWTSGTGVERQLGNPAFTPALVASLQAAEACKLLLGLGHPLKGRKLMIDLMHMEIDELALTRAPACNFGSNTDVALHP